MDPNITLIIQCAAFFSVAWLVMKFGWPHIMAAIEERQAKIAEGLAAADRSKSELAQAEERVNEQLREARGKAAEIKSSMPPSRKPSLKATARKRQPKRIFWRPPPRHAKTCASKCRLWLSRALKN